ncbi:MAG TPA: efflux RND transporter permease subunit, partial [Oxalicibacterium sp.]|nr:efflux RND transporter permease subunit [Oxalicibacterium sp.]
MWIVKLALRRPYTFIVMALLIFLSTPLVLMRMATDIFPEINIPVISIIWKYTGLSAEEVSQRITASNERVLTTTVNDIEHIESQSLPGVAVIKVFFQPGANIQTAIAQVTSVEQTIVKNMPPGATAPLIIQYSASTVPVMQLGLSSESMSEQSLFDTALNAVRTRLVTIPGVAIPYPYGGKSRVVSVDLDMQALQAKGMSPTDIINAINAQNLILPGGSAKFGSTEYTIKMNGAPNAIDELNDIPVRTTNGATVYLGEVAHVRDGFTPQTNIARQDGER